MLEAATIGVFTLTGYRTRKRAQLSRGWCWCPALVPHWLDPEADQIAS